MKKVLIVLITMLLVTSMFSVVYAKNNGKGQSGNKHNDNKTENVQNNNEDDEDKDESSAKDSTVYNNNESGVLKNELESYKKKVDALNEELKSYNNIKNEKKELLKEINGLKKLLNDRSLHFIFNGREIKLDTTIIIKNNKILIPLSPIIKSLGGNVKWDGKADTVTVTIDKTVVFIDLDEKVITLNEKKEKLDCPVELKYNEVFVPMSLITKILKYYTEHGKDTVPVVIGDETITTVNDNVTGTGNNQFEYAGSWQYGTQPGAYMNDNHWSVVDSVYGQPANQNVYSQIRFTGTKIKLFGAKAPNHGIAAISIDGGAEIAVDYYAQTRSDNTLIYESPVLSNQQHVLKIRATGARNNSSTNNTITIDRAEITTPPMTGVNLAKKRPTAASSFSATSNGTHLTPDRAVDGNAKTRWSSQYSDSQWIYVDLGVPQNISTIRLNWEEAYGKEYKIQVSNDAANWTDVYYTTAGKGGIEDIRINTVSARYVRMYGIQRATQWGYSLWEFEVYP